MSFIFGYDSYIVKIINPTELGLNYEEFKYGELQLRQRYFYLFLIPLFPIGKYWAITKNDKQYDVSKQLVAILDNQFPTYVFEWKAFTLLYVLLFVVMSCLFLNKTQFFNNTDSMFNEKSKQVKNIDENSFIVFGYFDKIYVKILKVEGDKLLVSKTQEKIRTKREYEFIMSEKTDIFMRFMSCNNCDSFWISKHDIFKCIRNNENFTGYIIKSIDSIKPLEISRIYKVDDAIFYLDTPFEFTSDNYFEFVNLGLDVRLDSIVPLNKDENWKISKERIVKYKNRFAIKMDKGILADLYYTTLNDNINHVTRFNKNSSYILHD